MAIAENLTRLFSSDSNLFVVLIFFTAVIVIYAVFVFYFYRFLAKKNLIELNLNQYNLYERPAVIKFFAALFYIIEYLILLPIITFFWFAVLSILVLLLAEGLEIKTVLLISAALVAAVRITAYVTEDLSKDLAKMLPFTLLAIAITTSGFFDAGALIARTSEIPLLFSKIPYYLLFIVGVELIMRMTEFFQSAIQSSETNTTE